MIGVSFLFSLFSAASSTASEPNFNRDVRPILSENCFLCHGQDPEHRGGDLRLDIREEAIADRDDGAAIVPGKPEESNIIKRIISTDPDMVMPPPKAHMAVLEPKKIEILKAWIENGAEYEPHWSFVPPAKSSFSGKSSNPVDAFVRERLKQEGLKSSPPAPVEAQLRRLHLDLTGLPPTIAEMDSYVADKAADRWEKRIKTLMESPHFAERMAIPWLDAARYSDTHGFSIDDHRDMWAWRDWLIHALMENQPYDQFLKEQIAGDLIPNATPDQIAATGFLRNSMNTHEGGTIAEEYRVAYTLDKVDAVSTTMLGLTMKCAQCHDHKYDQISQKDYYSFYAFFNTSSEPGKGATNASTKPVMVYESPLGDGGMSGLRDRVAELEYLKAHPKAEIVAARESWEARQDGAQAPLSIPTSERTLEQWGKVNELFIKAKEPLSKLASDMINAINVEIGVLEKDIKRGKTTVMVMDHKPELRKTYILERGAYDQYGEEVSAGTPHALPPLANTENPTRLDLAEWVIDPSNPLTARVAVNRLWQMVFGRGIVETAGDFGNQGSWPSHPELLDWLAVDLVENDWNLRHVLMTILMSETYRQSAVVTAESLSKDPRAELLSRSPRTRLAAEIIRDQALAVSGLLNPKIGGPGVHPPQPDLWSEISHFGYQKPFTAQIFLPGRGDTIYRRSVYTFWKRTSPPPAIALFDAPTRETCSVVRGNTNTPLQALVVMNESQYVDAAVALGKRMMKEGGETTEDRLAYGFRLGTGRQPNSAEKRLLIKAFERHLKRYANDADASHELTGEENPGTAAYAMVASTILNLDELINRP
ncbi:MAG: PSD1 and planctomycete cytochrome C domain-containing protein [Akkermansiaceae bacterium]